MLGYIDARIQIYGPLFMEATQKTDSWKRLQDLWAGLPDHNHVETLVLRDYDGYDHDDKGMSLTEVLHNPNRKMGHAFLLKAMLLGDPVLQEFPTRKETDQ